jgi:ethanolamine utilization protein EutP (predicted NTPase)
METTSDVGRCDQRHQLGIERTTFAEIAVEIEVHSCNDSKEAAPNQFPLMMVQPIIAVDECR